MHRIIVLLLLESVCSSVSGKKNEKFIVSSLEMAEEINTMNVGYALFKRASIFKDRFRRRTFHEPNLIRIKAEPNYLDGLN